jgi:hypothetical protein
VTKYFSIGESDSLFDKVRILKLLRHSNQHVEDRIDFVKNPNQFPIYGKLSWYAQESINSVEGVIVSLYSGYVNNKPEAKPELHNPSGKNNDKLINGVEFTGMIRINGLLEETTINIHEIFTNISEIINHFERQIRQNLSESLVKEKQFSDIVLKLFVLKYKSEE